MKLFVWSGRFLALMLEFFVVRLNRLFLAPWRASIFDVSSNWYS